MLENLTVVHSHDQAEFNNRVFEDIKINVAEGEKQILHFWEKRLVLACHYPIKLIQFTRQLQQGVSL